jgi:hypothetical protein
LPPVFCCLATGLPDGSKRGLFKEPGSTYGTVNLLLLESDIEVDTNY